MPCRTLLELSSHLDDRLAWRKKEISTLALAVRESSGIAQLVNSRAATCLLYAHWEGFIKQAAEAYLGFVAVRRHPRTALSQAFRALVYKKELGVLRDLAGADYATTVETCVVGSGGADDIEESGVIRTGSNLGYDMLVAILVTLGLDYSFYETRANLINKSLLERRNTIAHGRELDINPADFDDLRAKVVDMMDHFAVQVFMAASHRDYLTTMNATPSPVEAN